MTAQILEFHTTSALIDRGAMERARGQYRAGEISQEEMFEVWRGYLRHQGKEHHFEVIRAVYVAVQSVLCPEVRS